MIWCSRTRLPKPARLLWSATACSTHDELVVVDPLGGRSVSVAADPGDAMRPHPARGGASSSNSAVVLVSVVAALRRVDDEHRAGAGVREGHAREIAGDALARACRERDGHLPLRRRGLPD